MKAQRKRLALCLDNKDYKASLMAGKVYRVLPDAKAAQTAERLFEFLRGHDFLCELRDHVRN